MRAFDEIVSVEPDELGGCWILHTFDGEEPGGVTVIHIPPVLAVPVGCAVLRAAESFVCAGQLGLFDVPPAIGATWSASAGERRC